MDFVGNGACVLSIQRSKDNLQESAFFLLPSVQGTEHRLSEFGGKCLFPWGYFTTIRNTSFKGSDALFKPPQSCTTQMHLYTIGNTLLHIK